MFSYLNYIFGYADLNEYEADEKSKRLKYLCCETIKSSKIKLKKVNSLSEFRQTSIIKKKKFKK